MEEFEILVGLIREKGIADSEVQARLERWCLEKEQGIQQLDVPIIQIIGQVGFERDKARMWRESGYPIEAREALLDASYIAEQGKVETLANQIRGELEQEGF